MMPAEKTHDSPFPFRTISVALHNPLRDGLQEAEQGFVSREGAFRLDPVAGTFDDHLAAKIRHELIHCRQR